MRKYFLYELKKSLPALIGATVVFSVIMLFYIAANDFFDYSTSQAVGLITFTSVMGGMLATAIPLYIFNYKMKKRSLDLYFALPLSHTKLLAVKYLIGLVLVFAPYTAVYLLNIIAVAGCGITDLNFSYYPLHYLSTILPVYIIYSVSAFVYTRANNSLDGIIFIIFWTLALPLAISVLSLLFYFKHGTFDSISIESFFLYAPLNYSTDYFQHLLVDKAYGSYIGSWNLAIGLTLNSLLSVGSTVGIILFERRVKAENCQQISESFFGYKVMIPFYTAVSMIFCVNTDIAFAFTFAIIACVASYLTTALYKRNIKIGVRQIIILAASVVLGIILGFII